MEKIFILLILCMMAIVYTNAYSGSHHHHTSDGQHTHTSHCHSCCQCENIYTNPDCHSCCECQSGKCCESIYDQSPCTAFTNTEVINTDCTGYHHHHTGWDCNNNCNDHTERENCANFCKSKETTAAPVTQAAHTTPHDSTTQHVTHTASHGTYHTCDKLRVIEALAVEIKANDTSSLTCQGTDNKQRAEAFVSTHCNTGQVTGWKMGEQIAQNCQEIYSKTPYVAIASFRGGVYTSSETHHRAGVLVGCEADGFKMILQTCVDSPFVTKVTGSHGHSFHVILTN